MAVYRDTTTSRALTTNELFQKWVQMIHKGFTEVGLVQTSDTGQINPETVESPGTSATAGYEIWRFNDSNQSSDPIFFKILYGLGTTTSRPRLSMEFGSGSNGSGSLTGATSSFIFGAIANTASGTPEFHVCHVDGTLVFMEAAVASQTSANTYIFTCERLRNSSGEIITSGENKGWVLIANSGNVKNIVRRGGSDTTTQMISLGVGTEASPEGRVLLGAIVPSNFNYLTGILSGAAGQFVKGDEGKVTLYGTERKYRATGSILSSAPGVLGGDALPQCALLLNE